MTGVEHRRSPRHGRERRPRLPRGSLGGPGRVPRGRPLPDRRWRRSASDVRSSSATSTSSGRSTRSRSTRRSWTRTARTKPYVMGSYGIGITRIMAAAVEQTPRRRRHDLAQGAWRRSRRSWWSRPATTSGRSRRRERIYAELRERGVDVVLDDREETRRRQVQGRRPDRLPGPGGRRQAGRRGRDRGSQAARDRGADAGADRRGGVGRDRPAGAAPRKLVLVSARRRSRTTWSSS